MYKSGNERDSHNFDQNTIRQSGSCFNCAYVCFESRNNISPKYEYAFRLWRNARETALASGKRRPAAIKLESTTSETWGYETRTGYINALKVQPRMLVLREVCEWRAREKSSSCENRKREREGGGGGERKREEPVALGFCAPEITMQIRFPRWRLAPRLTTTKPKF